MMARSASPRPFRMIKKRTGGTLNFNPEPLPDYKSQYIGPDLIGTYGVSNGVCFYFKIDKLRCFMAHIAVNVRMASPEDMEEPDNRSVSAEEGAELKALVLVRLEKEAETQGWYPPAFDRDACVCCPFVQEDQGRYRFAMHYVVEAIRDFTGRGNLYVEQVEGFLMDQRSGRVLDDGWFEYQADTESGTEPEQVRRKMFEAKDVKGKMPRDWFFEMVREEMLEPLEVKKAVAKKGAGRRA